VIYFADDDNTYDIRLFKEIATTQKISMFPVGFIGLQGTYFYTWYFITLTLIR
jgi:hypothetical protein